MEVISIPEAVDRELRSRLYREECADVLRLDERQEEREGPKPSRRKRPDDGIQLSLLDLVASPVVP